MSETISTDTPLAAQELVSWGTPTAPSEGYHYSGTVKLQGELGQQGSMLSISETHGIKDPDNNIDMSYAKHAAFANTEDGLSLEGFTAWFKAQKGFVLSPTQISRVPFNGLYLRRRSLTLIPVSGIKVFKSADQRGRVAESVYINALGSLVINASHIERSSEAPKPGTNPANRRIIMPQRQTLELVTKLAELS